MARADTAADVIVAGGGAAGLACALAAARAGAQVAVLEGDVACARKVLATGNGRCNLTNESLDPGRYRYPAFAAAVLGNAPEERIARFWEGVGLVTTSTGGWVYPRSKRAESVRDALMGACERAGVRLRCAHEVRGARRDAASRRWLVDAWAPERPVRRRAGETERRYRRRVEEARHARVGFSAAAVVAATGGGAGVWAAWTGLPLAPESPVLCPVACRCADGALDRLDGLRADAALTLRRAGEPVAREVGEVLFRRYGVSGICAFNLSRRCEPGDALEVDLLPELAGEDAARAMLARRAELLGEPRDARWFDGLLARPLGEAVWERAGAAGGDRELVGRLARTLTCFSFEVTGLAETASAQVTRGGLALETFDPATLEARDLPGFFAVGEALDMDADCGGFNLAWAWLTGMRAGAAAAAAARNG